MQGNNIGTTNISELPISNNVGIINPPMQHGMSRGMREETGKGMCAILPIVHPHHSTNGSPVVVMG